MARKKGTGGVRARSTPKVGSSGANGGDIGGGHGAALAVAASIAAGVVGYVPWGATRDVDVPVLALSIAALVLAGSALRRIRRAGVLSALDQRWTSPVAAGVAALALSTFIGAHRWTSLFGAPSSSTGLLQLGALCCVLVGAAWAGTSLRRSLSAALPWFAGLQLLMVAYQLARGSHPLGTLSNSSYMGQVVLLALPVVAAPALEPGAGRRARAWRLGLVASAVVALVASESFAAAAISAAWAVWLVLRTITRTKTREWVSWAGATATASLLGATALVARPGLVASSFGQRADFWKVASDLALRAPVLGHGPDSFRVAAAALAPPSMLNGPPGAYVGHSILTADPHNLVLMVAASFGAVGIAVLAWAVYETVLNWRMTTGRAATGAQVGVAPGAELPRSAFIQASVLYAATLLIMPAPLQTAPLAALVLGASLALRPDGPVRRLQAPRRFLIMAALAVCVLGAVLSLTLASTHLAIGSGEAPDAAARGRLAASAANFWRSDPYLHYAASLRLGLTGDAAGDLEHLEAAYALDPDDPFYALERARALATYGAPAAVTRAAYEDAVELFPGSWEPALGYARYLMHEGDPVESLAAAERAVSLAPRYRETLELAAEAADRAGDRSRAADYRRRAAAAGATAPSSTP